ncbi:hypothetical protein BGZ52_004980 [Haplosporangium bisporale]|nr:hypothetical protein BGZ52_004980 [Haplosporangium bisporale]
MQPLRLFPISLAALLAISAIFTTVSATVAPSNRDPNHSDPLCRCLPDHPCWPSSAIWSAFKETVSGNLIATFPAARECHDPYYDKAKCDEIKKGYYDDGWRRTTPGALLQTNWETFHGQGCLGTNQSTSCYRGAVPIYTVKATSIGDVQETVRFASKHNIRLAIKNTGHDFLGRSTAPSSISLWVTAMNDMQVVDAFVTDGAPQGTQGEAAIVLGPGALWEDVYKFIDPYERVVIGGGYRSVGAVGGFCLGGGHGPLSPRHGLCADNVLQYKVITADGEVRIANDYQNQDLFWALRGGAPGFAVVVEAVYRTHPALKNINYAQAIIFSSDTDSIDKVVRDFYSRHDGWSKEGWSGYAAARGNGILIQYFLPDAGIDQAKESIQPFLDYARSFNTVVVVNDTVSQYPTFYTMFQAFQARGDELFGEKTAGVNALLGSRLIPRTLFQSDRGIDLLSSTLAKVQDDLTQIWPEAGFLVEFVAGGQVSLGNSQDTSVSPAWRDALVLIIGVIEWSDDTPYGTQLVLQRKLTKSINRLRKISPGGGTYQNEADPNEPDWQESFFGTNYPRLRSVHDKYDPNGLFVCRRCVGSEDWDNDLLCRTHH